VSVASGNKVLPTKIGLIQTRRSLRTSRTVYKILEDKRDVLLKRLDEMINQAQKSREDMWAPLSEAYRQLFDSYLKLGPATLEAVASNTPPTVDVSVNVRSIVSVQVPTMQITQKNVGLTYGFADTSASLDKATRMMRNVLPSILKAAEVENAIFRLATELEKTQRLLNALEYIIIPGYQGTIKFISSTLEEREREEFVRLKHVKKILEAKKGEGGDKVEELVETEEKVSTTVLTEDEENLF
jgi:V/A-type H+/Na+-transporting ATPase subunit D